MEAIIGILIGIFLIAGMIACFVEIPRFLGGFSKLREEDKYGGEVEDNSTTNTNVFDSNNNIVKKDG
ncbi:MAG: hypothetical protein PHE21_00955 [Candidatus Dojkabacteria bacterium]|nr:hypothetical protein [Candidatus Dojkabacteria bacterium]